MTRSCLGILVVLAAVPLLRGSADDGGCGGGVSPAESLCTSTGGTWDDGACPAACWPPQCGQSLALACVAVCGSQPVCRCPASAPFWKDGQGCLAPRACPGAPTCTGSAASSFELDVLALVNQERARAGIAALACSGSAAFVARDFAEYMCSAGFFSHVGPDGSTLATRLTAGGVTFSAAAENIAAGQATPKDVTLSWLASAGHKANLLGVTYTNVGVGYASCTTGSKHYWVQDFFK